MTNRKKEREISTAQRDLHALQESRALANRTIDRDPGNAAIVAKQDRDIAAVQTRLRELRGVTPGEQLAVIDADIVIVEAELRQLTEQKAAATVAKLQRDPEGAARLKQIIGQTAKAEARLSALRQQRGELQGRAAADRVAARKRVAEETPKQLAELHRERVGLSEMLFSSAVALASALKAMQENSEAIADLADNQSARNFFSAAAFQTRVANSLARAFAINPAAQLTAGNSLFGIASNAIGAQAHWTLTQWEQPGLDDLVPFYASEAEAEAARERLELRDFPTIVVPLARAFTLVPFEHVFGDETSARRAAARSATPVAVVAHDGGFVLIPDRFTKEAA